MTKKTEKVGSRNAQSMAATSTKAPKSKPVQRRSFRDVALNAIERSNLPGEDATVLKALLGIEGYAKLAMACDPLLRNEAALHVFTAIRRMAEHKYAGRTIVRVDIADDCGLSEIVAPRLRVQAIADRGTKMLANAGFVGFTSIREAPLRETRKPRRRWRSCYAGSDSLRRVAMPTSYKRRCAAGLS